MLLAHRHEWKVIPLKGMQRKVKVELLATVKFRDQNDHLIPMPSGATIEKNPIIEERLRGAIKSSLLH